MFSGNTVAVSDVKSPVAPQAKAELSLRLETHREFPSSQLPRQPPPSIAWEGRLRPRPGTSGISTGAREKKHSSRSSIL